MAIAQKRRGRRLAATLAVAGLFTAACAEPESPSGPGMGIDVGFLPTERGLTDKVDQFIDLWNGAWIAALSVGALIWVLTIWCIVVYRKRKGDNELPVQFRYHVPLELLYTIIPIVMVGTLFVFSSRATAEMQSTDKEPTVEIEVYGKQWTWDFNYLTDDVYYSGERIELMGNEVGAEEKLPTLYLPVGETVEFTIKSRDVIHSFWIPSFLYKIDMIPGRVATYQVTPQKEGVYSGKCAELCGEFHAEMIFNVAVVDRETYDAEMDKLREAGQTGARGDEYNRQYMIEESDNGEH